MSWMALFFGGVFVANFVPHFVTGVLGQPFYSPFAKPRFRGLSSPVVNVLWGLFNLGMGVGLAAGVGIDASRTSHLLTFGLGFGLAAVGLARSVGRLRREQAPG